MQYTRKELYNEHFEPWHGASNRPTSRDMPPLGVYCSADELITALLWIPSVHALVLAIGDFRAELAPAASVANK